MIALFSVVVPILTFVLGCVFALWLRRRSEREIATRRSLQGVTELCKRWYGQIHDIAIQVRRGDPLEEVRAAMLAYEHNREILPSLLYDLEVLSRSRGCEQLVEELKGFLKTVTDYDGDRRDIRCVCVPCRSYDLSYEWSRARPSHPAPERGDVSKSVVPAKVVAETALSEGRGPGRDRTDPLPSLATLDARLQAISRSAAAATIGSKRRWRHLT